MTTPTLFWFHQAKHGHKGPGNREANDHLQHGAGQLAFHVTPPFLVPLRVIVLVVDLARWDWTDSPLRDWGEDGRYSYVAEGGVAS